jgi:predicted nucleic acid-binding Zn ribbon protein
MVYRYICNDCSTKKKWLIFETQHGMNEKPKVKCPRCGGTNTEVCFAGQDTVFFIRGNGWLDVKGRRRDMHLYKLLNEDPYSDMREPGEKDELAASLRKGGKHNPKPKAFYLSPKTSR